MKTSTDGLEVMIYLRRLLLLVHVISWRLLVSVYDLHTIVICSMFCVHTNIVGCYMYMRRLLFQCVHIKVVYAMIYVHYDGQLD